MYVAIIFTTAVLRTFTPETFFLIGADIEL